MFARLEVQATRGFTLDAASVERVLATSTSASKGQDRAHAVLNKALGFAEQAQDEPAD